MFSNVNPDLDSLDSPSLVIPLGMDTIGKRVRWALKQRGRKASDLAKELGITRSAISQWWQINGPTSPGRHLRRVADFLECNEEWLRDGRGPPFSRLRVAQSQSGPLRLMSGSAQSGVIYTLGEVGAGMFLSVSETSDLNFQREPSAFPPLPEYPVESQYDLIIRGTSIDRFARDGERVRCVSVQATGFHSGDYVHVERYRHQRSEVENTIKQAFFVNSRWELRFASFDPRWKDQAPLTVGQSEDEQIEVVGVALYQFFPSPTRRRSPTE